MGKTEGPGAGTIVSAIVPEVCVHFVYGVTSFVHDVTLKQQRITLEQHFMGPTHVKIWTLQILLAKSWPLTDRDDSLPPSPRRRS